MRPSARRRCPSLTSSALSASRWAVGSSRSREAGRTEEKTGKGDALGLADREALAAFADACVQSGGQPWQELIDPRPARRPAISASEASRRPRTML